jgi:UDP-3-O-[3-hydroxymyristoyl] glucosamine N-acyltransferase
MADQLESKTLKLSEIAALIGGKVLSGEDFVVTCLASSKSVQSSGLAFAESANYLKEAAASAVGAVIIPDTVSDFAKPAIQHPSPRTAFGILLNHFKTPYLINPEIHPTAVIHPLAQVHPNVKVGAYAVIEAGTFVEEDAEIFAHVYVGENCHIGHGTRILPSAIILKNVRIGRHVEIAPGAVIGYSGFGYYWDGKKQVPVPQIGGVQIHDHAEIGANSTVDRATVDDTIIGEGTKVDNQVQIGHNVQIGKHSVFASQIGIGGSTIIGDRNMAGGQSGYSDHVNVADGVTIAGRAGVTTDLMEPGQYAGMPAIPISSHRRNKVIEHNLSGLVKRVKELEKRLKELEKNDH